jgi:zinc protease
MIAFSAPSAKNKNRYAFSVLDSLLSGAGSRLFHNLREQKSLAYQVGSFTMTGFEPGMWTFYIVTSEETREKAKGGLLEEIKKIKDLKFTQEEVEQTKRYLIGQHYINLQTNSALSFKCALDEMYSLGYDNYKEYEKNIAAVTIKDIEKIINEYIDLDNYTLLIIKPRKIRQ